MSTNSVRKQLIEKFRDKEYRDGFVSERIFSGLPLKIHALREQRRLSQKQLGEKAGVAQAWVSKLEDPNYGKLTLSTLMRLASALDVGLEVDFVPFSRVLDAALSLSQESFKVASFSEDKKLSCKDEADTVQKRLPIIGAGETHHTTLCCWRADTHCRTRQVRAPGLILKQLRVTPPSVFGQHSCGGASRNLMRRQQTA
jgi:transcriptional regulator with XRE-family HTH domain